MRRRKRIHNIKILEVNMRTWLYTYKNKLHTYPKYDIIERVALWKMFYLQYLRAIHLPVTLLLKVIMGSI